jgi:hypothetical protein
MHVAMQPEHTWYPGGAQSADSYSHSASPSQRAARAARAAAASASAAKAASRNAAGRMERTRRWVT